MSYRFEPARSWLMFHQFLSLNCEHVEPLGIYNTLESIYISWRLLRISSISSYIVTIRLEYIIEKIAAGKLIFPLE